MNSVISSNVSFKTERRKYYILARSEYFIYPIQNLPKSHTKINEQNYLITSIYHISKKYFLLLQQLQSLPFPTTVTLPLSFITTNQMVTNRSCNSNKRVRSWSHGTPRVYHKHGTPRSIFVINQNFVCSFDTKFAHLDILFILLICSFAHFIIKVFAHFLK